MRKLPPLNPLKAFESAARHGSLTRAAEELGVSQVAVSRQVRVLETYLGVDLFVRSHRHLHLTRDGRTLAQRVRPAFDEIDAVTAALSRRDRRRILSIESYRTFSQHWLIPRLSDFHDSHPDIEIRLTAAAPDAPDWQNIDAAVRSGLGVWDDAETQLLAPLELVTVCSPRYLAHHGPLAGAGDLKHHTLLHSLTRPTDWAAWAGAAGLTTEQVSSGLKFQNSALAYEAALQGLGVAMGMRVLVEQYLRDKALVMPLAFAHTIAGGYFLAWPSGVRPSPALMSFRRWLQRRVAEDRTAQDTNAASSSVSAIPTPACIA